MANTRRIKKSNRGKTMRGGLLGVEGLGRRIRGFFGGPAPSNINLAQTESQRQTRDFGSGIASGARAVGSAVGAAGRATYNQFAAQSYFPKTNFNNALTQINKYRKAGKAQNAINAVNAYKKNYMRISQNNASSPYLKQLNNSLKKAQNNTSTAAWRNTPEYLEYLNRVNKPKAQQVRNRLAAKAAAENINLVNMSIPSNAAGRASRISNLFGPNQAASAMAAVNSAAAAKAAAAADNAARVNIAASMGNGNGNGNAANAGVNAFVNRAAANAAQEAYDAALTAKETACNACEAAKEALAQANGKRSSSRKSRKNRRSRKTRKSRR